MANNQKGKELFKYIQRKICATGTVKQDEDGVKIIFVRSYTVLKSDTRPVTKYEDAGEDL